jgi:hypothetical protein
MLGKDGAAIRTKVILWSPTSTTLLVTTAGDAAEISLTGADPLAPSSAKAAARKNTGQSAASLAGADFIERGLSKKSLQALIEEPRDVVQGVENKQKKTEI